MKAKELRPQSADQLKQTQLALESELLRHVSSVSANSSEAKKTSRDSERFGPRVNVAETEKSLSWI